MLIFVVFSCSCVLGKTTNTAKTDEAAVSPVTSYAVPQAVTTVAATEAVSKQASNHETKTAVTHKAPVKKVKTVETANAGPIPTPDALTKLVDDIKAADKNFYATKTNITLKTTYTQAQASGAAQAPQVAKGAEIIEKKDKFRVHYTEPTEQIMVSDGKTIWIYTPELKQVMKQSMEGADMNAKVFTDMGNSIARYVKNSKTTLTSDDNTYSLDMVPLKDSGLNYEEVTAKIDKKSMEPVYLSMKYDGALMEVTFEDTVNYTKAQAAKEPSLSSKNFSFKAPEGTEEIDAASLTGSMQKDSAK
jgi:outer membrane lipoprotein carrier protein